MNIALVVFRLNEPLGGAERYTISLAHELIARGHTIQILSSNFRDDEKLPHTLARSRGATRFGKYHAFLDSVDALQNGMKFDIVHSMMPIRRMDVYQPQAGFESLNLKKSEGLKFLANKINLKRQAQVAIEEISLRAAKGPITICLSNRERQAAIEHFGGSAARFETVYLAIDINKYQPVDDAGKRRAKQTFGIGSDTTVFAFIGNDFRRKNLAACIKAMARANQPKAFLLVAGSDNPTMYSSLALKLGLLGRVIFVGQTADSTQVLHASDALILPSKHEPFGMVVIEAMSCGVVPVVSNVAGASEVVHHDVDGIVIHEGNEQPALIDAINRLCDRVSRENLAAECIRRREEFGFDRHVSRIEKIYERVMSERRR